MGFAAFAFLVIFLLIASGGLLLFYREAMLQRISAVVTPRVKQPGLLERDSTDRFLARQHGGASGARPAEEPGGGLGRRNSA